MLLTTRRDLLQIGLSGICAVPLFAAEAWDKKPVAELTDKDIEKLMNKSPWAKKFAVDTGRGPAAFSGPATGGGGGGRGAGGGGGGPQGGGGAGPDDAGAGGPGGAMGGSTPEALVRWETALPVLEAQKKQLPDAFRNSYAISVTGFPLGGPRPGGAGGPMPGGAPGGPGAGAGKGGGFNPEAMRAAQQQMMEAAKQSTRLERKGKDPMAPSVMAITGRSLVILFPRDAQPLTLDDKEVTLVLKIGLPEMKAKFSLKDMVYMGKLEL
jgi:hypothetical protein